MKKDAKKIKISACMMVKNEEEMLPRCLNSIKHLIDELIIVDTGSTDKTVEIAQSFGAKIYHHPWENNFSKHRNQSLCYATGNWILLVDADEELNAYQIEKNQLKKKLADAPNPLNCYLIKVLDKNRRGEISSVTESIRIFRNHVGIEYRGIVHNRLHYSGKVGHLDLQLFHYGYALSDAQMKAKYKRTSGLLFRRIEENPEDYDAYFYQYQVHSEMGKKEEAIKYAMRCLELIEEKGVNPTEASFYYSLYYGIASVFMKLGKYDQALSAVRKGLEVLPDEVDLYYNLAAIGYFSGQSNLSIEGGKNYFRVVDNFRSDSSRSGTRFIFTTAQHAEITVCFWLMTGLIAEGQFAEFPDLWEKYKENMLEKPGFQKELFKLLEKAEAFECLESVAVFLLNNLEKIHAANHQMIYSFLVFYLRERKAYQKESNSELDELFKNVAGNYLNALASYNDMPTTDAVVIAEYLLENSMGQFFLDLTLVVFERELAGQIKVIDSDETIIQGYNKIAQSQEHNRKGKLLSLLCLNICKGLAGTKEGQPAEPSPRKLPEDHLPYDVEKESRKSVAMTRSMANKHPLVSIGLPVYNGGQDLEKAIQSILNQGFEHFELIISDNCSTDNTEEICRKYADQDKRIFYNRFNKNYGLLMNWQKVYGLAKGNFFVFAQHDNTYQSNFLSACLSEFSKDSTNCLGIVFPQINIFDKEGNYRPYSDPLQPVQDDPLERYLHVLWKIDLNNAILGMMRPEVLIGHRVFFGSLNTKVLFGDHASMTEIALKKKIKQINPRVLNRQMSDYKKGNFQERNIKLINAACGNIMADGLTLPFVGIIRKQMEVIKYSELSFSQKDFLIKETIKCLKQRFGVHMKLEIQRAVELIKNNSFYTMWDGRTLPANTLNELKFFKREYMYSLIGDLENALFVFPENDDLKKAVGTCKNFINSK